MISSLEDMERILEGADLFENLAVASTSERLFNILEKEESVQEILKELLSDNYDWAGFSLGYHMMKYSVDMENDLNLFYSKTYSVCTTLYLIYKVGLEPGSHWSFDKSVGYIQYITDKCNKGKGLFVVRSFGEFLLGNLRAIKSFSKM